MRNRHMMMASAAVASDLQTFGASTARALAARRIGLPVVLLIDAGRGPWDSPPS